MEALGFLKFWRFAGKTSSSPTLPHQDLPIEGDDSFFELELSISDFVNHNSFMNPHNAGNEKVDSFTLSDGEEDDEEEKSERRETVFSKKKIIPVETCPNKPQSPINLLKSAPKFRAFSFKKSKSSLSEKQKRADARTKRDDGGCETFSAANFKGTVTSSKKESSGDALSSDYYSSKRFSKEGVQKYLNDLIKPLYGKKQCKNHHPPATASPSSSPAIAPSRKWQPGVPPSGAWKHFGKSRSAAAVIGSPSPASRVDESQQDGIQSAILHCKRSYNSSRESSLLSRSMSSSSQEKVSTSSSEDYCGLSRLTSDSISVDKPNCHEKIDVSRPEEQNREPLSLSPCTRSVGI